MNAAASPVQKLPAITSAKQHSSEVGVVYDSVSSEMRSDEDGSTFQEPANCTNLEITAISAFANDFLDGVVHKLQRGQSQLQELTTNQNVLIETLQHENSKFSECESFQQLADTISKAKVYHQKLVSLKKEMISLQEKSGKLRRRAVRIQQQKQKEELQRANQHEKDMERERALMARPPPCKEDPT